MTFPSRKKSLPCVGKRGLVGCPEGLEPSISRSTIWRVNRLRYGHHSNAPEGTRTPGPLLRRQLLYPPELRAHVVIPKGTCMRQQQLGVCCVARDILPYSPRSVKKNRKKLFSRFSRPQSHIPRTPSPKPRAAPAATSRGAWTPASTRTTQTPAAAAAMIQPTGG